jgi:hypothetical protein
MTKSKKKIATQIMDYGLFDLLFLLLHSLGPHEAFLPFSPSPAFGLAAGDTDLLFSSPTP